MIRRSIPGCGDATVETGDGEPFRAISVSIPPKKYYGVRIAADSEVDCCVVSFGGGGGQRHHAIPNFAAFAAGTLRVAEGPSIAGNGAVLSVERPWVGEFEAGEVSVSPLRFTESEDGQRPARLILEFLETPIEASAPLTKRAPLISEWSLCVATGFTGQALYMRWYTFGRNRFDFMIQNNTASAGSPTGTWGLYLAERQLKQQANGDFIFGLVNGGDAVASGSFTGTAPAIIQYQGDSKSDMYYLIIDYTVTGTQEWWGRFTAED